MSSKAKAGHTPGPWLDDPGYGQHIIYHIDKIICLVPGDYRKPSEDETEANVALILQAPMLKAQRDELLAAAKKVTESPTAAEKLEGIAELIAVITAIEKGEQ